MSFSPKFGRCCGIAEGSSATAAVASAIFLFFFFGFFFYYFLYIFFSLSTFFFRFGGGGGVTQFDSSVALSRGTNFVGFFLGYLLIDLSAFLLVSTGIYLVLLGFT